MSKRHIHRNPPLATEHAEQAALIEWWDLACTKYNLPPWSLFAIPNGAKLPWGRNQKGERFSPEANKLKAEGLRPGVPDLMLAVPRIERGTNMGDASICIAHGLYVEMKRRPNKPSAEQDAILLYLRQLGYQAIVAYSADEAISAIKAYLA